MKRLFALVALVGVFTLSALFVRGQDEDEPRPVKHFGFSDSIIRDSSSVLSERESIAIFAK
ncbi:MAG: hypothetical protein WCL32_15170 [Planctomycetota bacterium]